MPAVRRFQLHLHIRVARQLVQTRDDQMIFKEPVSSPRRFKLVVRQNLEWQMEAPVEFVLPLLGKASRRLAECSPIH
jgi:hypothetical protein